MKKSENSLNVAYLLFYIHYKVYDKYYNDKLSEEGLEAKEINKQTYFAI